MKNLTFWFPSILFCFEFICSWKKRALRNNKKLKNWEIWQYNKLKIEGNQNVKFLVKQSPISNDSLLTLSMVEKFNKLIIKRSRCSVKSNRLQGMSRLFSVGYSEKYVQDIQDTPHKKWSFPLRISSVNVTKSAGNCGLGRIY